jgi:glycosyltransferase involved in cell wall biosynthesis
LVEASDLSISVVVSTYNHPAWLEKVLWGYAAQTHRNFELVIADDGSTIDTLRVVERLRDATRMSIRHVWHDHRGFRKCRILNAAVLAARGDYLVFTDGDCIPRSDFLAQHARLARAGCLLSGGTVRLTQAVSERIERGHILEGMATDPRWLVAQGLEPSRKLWLLTRSPLRAAMLDAVTTTKPTFNGHNTSVWKADVIAVNGFDERMVYGGLDRELGERLQNAGIVGLQVRHRAVCVHLDHPRGYCTAEGWQHNHEVREVTRTTGRVWTHHGIRPTEQSHSRAA